MRNIYKLFCLLLLCVNSLAVFGGQEKNILVILYLDELGEDTNRDAIDFISTRMLSRGKVDDALFLHTPSITKLNAALEELKNNEEIKISHLIVYGHGISHPERMVIMVGNEGEQLSFHKGLLSSSPGLLKGKFTENTKVFLLSCELFAHGEQNAVAKASYFKEILGLPDRVEIFGYQFQTIPIFNLLLMMPRHIAIYSFDSFIEGSLIASERGYVVMFNGNNDIRVREVYAYDYINDEF